MATTIVDVIDELRRDAWDKWRWESDQPSSQKYAVYLDKLRERLKDYPDENPAHALGKELGMEWASRCYKKIINTDITHPFDQLDRETLPPLFQEIESKLDSDELEYFRSGFGWGVADYQYVIEWTKNGSLWYERSLI